MSSKTMVSTLGCRTRGSHTHTHTHLSLVGAYFKGSKLRRPDPICEMDVSEAAKDLEGWDTCIFVCEIHPCKTREPARYHVFFIASAKWTYAWDWKASWSGLASCRASPAGSETHPPPDPRRTAPAARVRARLDLHPTPACTTER